MIYLGTNEILTVGKDWKELVNIISDATVLIREKDFAQPVKPYLRYRDLTNRIIAMPAYVGGDVAMAGIKWIASFPSNIERGLHRAHSVTILNEADSGVPISIFNTTLISAIRTAAVSGFFLTEMKRRRKFRKALKIGIAGFGVIGQIHLEMLQAVLGDAIGAVVLYDIRPIAAESIPADLDVTVVSTWEEAYQDADIFITCTVSPERYINIPPKKGSLQLNVSLRDYLPSLLPYMSYIVVDNWEEICRENTDIEKMHLELSLQEKDTISIPELTLPGILPQIGVDDVVMFNPMGMAVYDIAIASYYYRKSVADNIGIQLQ
ncbi:2,3-diaminopropionate biosynthesis protein SbnB [Chitinophaga nivalis]|uniref:2,3-diaminopropionate biosynthesis protein SbnB n=1 Tax=Chitinophaga nivalis TaxID=2991709 RepID=A0ABT3II00_9BACT|nr:2,3-diaminopropionate biosynthesis protein SbnB [Chitinophaga nivalis]MCW3466722.1 2,3-diaminopropionate biosynthesis protein SbnB [Chitinophaga nivalis]MCW3483587.1 2,3-diaminopropionate biosynthesis protein SbnB [Chitinophaga nivalis]